MTTATITLDDEVLTWAARILGTVTAEDTVNAALRAVVAKERQGSTLERAAKDGRYASLPAGDEAW